MRVISNRKLREYWTVHPNAERPLKAWARTIRRENFPSFAAFRSVFGRRVDRVGQLLVFDVGGNNIRVIVAVHFNKGRLFVRNVLTHAEYDRGQWKE